jgi:hypothetical protein
VNLAADWSSKTHWYNFHSCLNNLEETCHRYFSYHSVCYKHFQPKCLQKILLPEGLTIFFELHISILNNYHTNILRPMCNCKIYFLVACLLKTDFQFILHLHDKSIYAHGYMCPVTYYYSPNMFWALLWS